MSFLTDPVFLTAFFTFLTVIVTKWMDKREKKQINDKLDDNTAKTQESVDLTKKGNDIAKEGIVAAKEAFTEANNFNLKYPHILKRLETLERANEQRTGGS